MPCSARRTRRAAARAIPEGLSAPRAARDDGGLSRRLCRAFRTRPRFGKTVRSIRRKDGGYLIETRTETFSAGEVVASGSNAEPFVPSLPEIEAFKGRRLHSADYTVASPFAGQSVLVVEKCSIARPKQGILEQVNAGRIPVIDFGTVNTIKSATARWHQTSSVSSSAAPNADVQSGRHEQEGIVVARSAVAGKLTALEKWHCC